MRINLEVKRGDSLSLSFNCFDIRSQPQAIVGCAALLELIPTDGSEPGDEQLIYNTDPDGGLEILENEGQVHWNIPYQTIENFSGHDYKFALQLIYPSSERASTETMFLSIIED